MIAASVVMTLMLWNGMLGRVEAGLLLGGLLGSRELIQELGYSAQVSA